MDNKLSSIFALIFIIFIALISFWLNHEVKKELLDKEKGFNSAADFYLSNFASKHMNQAGTIKYTISGKEMKNYKFAEKTDYIVVTAGVPFNVPGSTNILRVAPCDEQLISSSEPE